MLDQRPTLKAEKLAQRDAVAKKVENLLKAIEDGATSRTLTASLTAREQELARLNAELATLDEALQERLAVMPARVRQQVQDVAGLLRESPERTKRTFEQLGVEFTISPIRDEAERRYLRPQETRKFRQFSRGPTTTSLLPSHRTFDEDCEIRDGDALHVLSQRAHDGRRSDGRRTVA